MSTLTNFLTDIANAIRSKTGETGAIPASDFASKIASIEAGGGPLPTYTLTFTANYGGENGVIYTNEKSQLVYTGALPKGTYTANVAKGSLIYIIGIGNGSSIYVSIAGVRLLSVTGPMSADQKTSWQNDVASLYNISNLKDLKCGYVSYDVIMSN